MGNEKIYLKGKQYKNEKESEEIKEISIELDLVRPGADGYYEISESAADEFDNYII